MSDLIIVRARFQTDVLYEVREGKELTPPLLTRMSNRIGTYARTGAVEGLEDRMRVLFEEEHRNQHAHHHDARYEFCAICRNASRDQLGRID